MVRSPELAEELRDLQSDIRASEASRATERTASADKMAGSAQTTSEVSRLLEELQSALSEVKAETGDVVTSHPLISLTSAFLLGVIVGRLMGRT